MAISSSQVLLHHVNPSASTATHNHRLRLSSPAPIPYSPSLSIRRSCRIPTIIKRGAFRTSLPDPQDLELVGEGEEHWKEEELINAIGDELSSFGQMVADDNFQYSMLHALTMVDLTERLGIQRYFQNQINKILSSTFTRWDKMQGLKHARDTVLAFRLLRHHGFSVSADVLLGFKDGEERGFSSSFSTRTHNEISAMLNLYRCSDMSFPSESEIMGEAKEFSRSQLLVALSDESSCLQQSAGLRSEIVFAMEFPRQCLLPRLESRCVITQLWPGDTCTRKYLSLARLDLQILQKQYQEELVELDMWWTQQGFEKVGCSRSYLSKCLFAVAPTLFEPQFSQYRLAFAKIVYLTVIIDGLFDDKNCNLEGLQRFSEAVRSWNPSLLDDLPHHKLVLTSVCDTMLKMALEGGKVQGDDLLPLFKDLWARYVDTFLTEAQWIHNNYIPTFEEYMKVANYSSGGVIITWTTIFLMGERMTPEIINHIGTDSRFTFLIGLVTRLANDVAGFARDKRDGKMATSVNSYQKENPQHSLEEAVDIIKGMIHSGCQELEEELYLSREVVPECCSRAVINFARTSCFTYKIEDSFHNDIGEYLQLFNQFLFDSLE